MPVIQIDIKFTTFPKLGDLSLWASRLAKGHVLDFDHHKLPGYYVYTETS
jgi:hypothetical protein